MKKFLLSIANKIIDKYGVHEDKIYKIEYDSKLEITGHTYYISSITQFSDYNTGSTSITINGIE